ncbi:MAG: hypothetical protein OEZ03_12825 [Alphaproteobacteria bacterium]|nr:hypothetical protein [Alphaproteobacteria bacterium]
MTQQSPTPLSATGLSVAANGGGFPVDGHAVIDRLDTPAPHEELAAGEPPAPLGWAWA